MRRDPYEHGIPTGEYDEWEFWVEGCSWAAQHLVQIGLGTMRQRLLAAVRLASTEQHFAVEFSCHSVDRVLERFARHRAGIEADVSTWSDVVIQAYEEL